MNAHPLTARSIKAVLCALFVACALSLLTLTPQSAWAAGDVAKIGDQSYATVQEAVDAAGNGDTIQIVADSTESIVIPNDLTVTLNVANGVTLTNEAGKHTITNNGALTITGGGTIDNVSHAVSALFNNGSVSLEGCTFSRSKEASIDADHSGGNSCYVIVNHGDMVIDSGVEVMFSESNSGVFSSMIENGYQSYKSGNQSNGYVAGINKPHPSLIIDGGVFVGGLNTVKNDDGGILTINGGSFTNTAQSAVLNWNEATITSGEFEVSTDYCVIMNGRDDSNVSASGEALNQGFLSISGGSFTAPEGIDAIGKFSNGTDMTKVGVSGGSFSDAGILAYAESGLVALAEADGTFTIMTADEAKAQKAISVVSTDDGDIYFLDSEDASEFTKDNPNVKPAAPITYTVTFIYGADPATQSEAVKVNAGEAVKPFAPPAFEGYTFVGWFSDENRTVAYDMDAPIWEDTTLYADWEKAKDPTPPVTPEDENTTDETDNKSTDDDKSATPKTSDGLGMAALALGCIVVASGAVAVAARRKMTR